MGDRLIQHSKPTFGIEEEQAVLEVLRSEYIVQGPRVRKFEEAVAKYVGRKYAVAVSSGVAALHLSLLGLDIKEGDEVIIPSYTCDALLNAVMYLKAKPVIIDVDYEDGNLSYELCKKALNSRTKAILLPHTLGYPVDIDKFLEIGIPVVEDCAIAIGGEYKGRKLGSFGDVSAFSFYATKMMAAGEGGMILTDDKKIADEVRDLRDYTGNNIFRIRYNYKMTDMEAALGICQLKKLDSFVDSRRKLFDRYIELLKDRQDIVLPKFKYESGTHPAYYRFMIKVPGYDSDVIIREMKKCGISCGRGVLQPLHRLLELDKRYYNNAERLANESLSLPIYPTLRVADVEYIVGNLNSVLEGLK